MTDLLRAIARGDRLAGRHVIVTAHPDDETVSCAGLLSAVEDAVIVQLTTGAPLTDLATATQRRHERDAAMAAGSWPWPVIDAGVPGREAHRSLTALRRLLAVALKGADAVWTHPYEGGHLDHDTAAWLVQRMAGAVPRFEFASYHCNAKTQTFGDFWPDATSPTVRVNLTTDTLARKMAAVAAYVSQASILRKFPKLDVEAYRAAPVYDFQQPSAPPRCRWDVKGYQPSTRVWRKAVAAEVAA